MGHFNETLSFERSYYVASANPFEAAPRLDGDIEADVCVVGGGCTGLSAALFARRKGYSVVLIEAGKIGWGASGRNGGQMIPGLRKSAPELVGRYGKARAKTMFDVAIEARDLVVGLVREHGIACDLRLTGHLAAALKANGEREYAEEAECLVSTMGYRHIDLLDRAAMREEVASSRFTAGMLDRNGGHLHPLNYTLGLADAARAAGVRLFEHTAATACVEQDRVRISTAGGAISARFAVLACDALLQGLDPVLDAKIMPVANYIVATEQLTAGEPILPRDRAVSDAKFVVDYFRMSADGRLLFGGGERYTPAPPPDIAGFVRPYMLALFPQLAGVKIDYGWGGLVSVTRTRLPDIGRRGNVFHAHGYSGMGVILTSLAGQLVAEAMTGTAERFDILAELSPPAFPGGTRLRHPLYVLGMLWYALRDRL
jgi:gamma-glutamylputrescine oxidase